MTDVLVRLRATPGRLPRMRHHDSKFFRGPEQADEITDRALLLTTGGEQGMQALRDLAGGHEDGRVRRTAAEVLSFVNGE